MRLWLVRHGETESNAGGIFQGHLDVALNAHGEEQARRLGAVLADVPFAGAYASDLRRAAQTADLIAQGRFPVVLDRDLREMHYGVLQGVRYRDAVNVLAPYGLSEAWLNGEVHRGRYTLPDGESLRQFRQRTACFVKRIDAKYGDDPTANVLIVAHGGQLAVLLTVLLGMPAHARYSFRFANCRVTILSRGATYTMLDVHNAVANNSSIEAFSDRGLSGQLPQQVE